MDETGAYYTESSLVAQMVKNLPAKQMQVQSLGWKDPLKKEMAHSEAIDSLRKTLR